MLKKSLMAVILSIVFALIMGTSGAFAAEAEMSKEVKEALVQVEKTNSEIYEEINKAVEKSYEMFDKYQIDLAKESNPQKQSDITAAYEVKITDLITKLDIKTQDMTKKGVEKARESGLEVEIEWIPVQFADRIAMIDPIKVMNW